MVDEDIVIICDQINHMKAEGRWSMCAVCAVEIFLCDLTVRQIQKDGRQVNDSDLYCLV